MTNQKLEKSFDNVHTLPGTKSFHNLRPLDSSATVEARRISEGEEPALTYCLIKQNLALIKEGDLFPGLYIACYILKNLLKYKRLFFKLINNTCVIKLLKKINVIILCHYYL